MTTFLEKPSGEDGGSTSGMDSFRLTVGVAGAADRSRTGTAARRVGIAPLTTHLDLAFNSRQGSAATEQRGE
jgi:hypothetical protein